MKRSKLFLGATTCVLAIAGVAATKAARIQALHTYFYCTATSVAPKCLPYQVDCGPIGAIACTAKVFSSVNQLYTLYQNGSATEPGFCGIGNNCTPAFVATRVSK